MEPHLGDAAYVNTFPWIALAFLAVAVALLLIRRGRGIPAAHVLAALVLAASACGVLEHVLVNYESGALDQRYSESWDTLPPCSSGGWP
jgi:hypothetical protein